MKIHWNIRFFGAVQGVFFRQTVKEIAEKLGVVGFVRNEPDGSVYAEAEGEEEILKVFLESCKKSKIANVSEVTITKSDLKNFPDFRIEY